jgi:hypothetical protein
MSIGCMLSIMFNEVCYCSDNHEIACNGSEEEKKRCPKWGFYYGMKEHNDLIFRLRR